MSPDRALAIAAATCSIAVALVLSPWNTASLRTTLEINATAVVVRENCLSFPLQQHWSNKFSANISVVNLATSTQIYDGRTLRKGDVLQIKNYFGTGYTAVKENSKAVFTLKGTKFCTTAAHTWEFVPTQDGLATKLLQREDWTGGVSFLFMRFGPVRGLLEEMFGRFNVEVKESAESAE